MNTNQWNDTTSANSAELRAPATGRPDHWVPADTRILSTQLHYGNERKQRLLRGHLDGDTQDSPAGFPCVMLFDENDRATYVPAGGTLELE